MNGNLDIARKDLKSAIILLNASDEDCLNSACFNVEQALELCCKFMLERVGKGMNKHRDIPTILHSVQQSGYILDPVFREYGSILRSWAMDSRYNFNFKVTHDTCALLCEKTRTLHNYCVQLELQGPIPNTTNYFGQ